MTPTGKRPSILRLKKRAKAMRKEAYLSQSQALDSVAVLQGYSGWTALLASYARLDQQEGGAA